MIPEFTDGYFKVSREHGFLPIYEPLSILPSKYEKLQNIIDKLSSCLTNVNVDIIFEKISDFENLEDNIREETDINLLAALYRAYCFLASGYLLYPSYVSFVKTGEYGRGRDRLPIQLSQPLLYLAYKLDVYPWLEYSYGYSLGNYVKKDISKGLDVENLRMACEFSATSDETGFIMCHVDINQHTPNLIGACDNLLEHMNVSSLEEVVNVLRNINSSRRKMWEVSRCSHYNDFRVYIMGIKGNTNIFPNGVIYEPETEPRYYRGQSGSQDTIIPFLDSFFRVCDHYPKNDLTNYLMDMRSYRPAPFRDLVRWTDTHCVDLISRLMARDVDGMICSLLYQVYRQMYEFRNGHWQFVQKYIMANTAYPVATGGTPITTWLPNQIMATLSSMRIVLNYAERFHNNKNIEWLAYEEEFSNMLKLLEDQSILLKCDNYNANDVFNLNCTYRQSDK
jgi:indoleamine 2,3-dioxygenase